MTQMKKQNSDQSKLAADQVLSVTEAPHTETEPAGTSTSGITQGEKAEAQSKSYARSRNLALMKLAFLQGTDNEAG